MVTIKVKDGTPQGAETLCVTCRWAHIVKGFRESEKEIFCRYLTDDRPVRFPVSQCNSYDDRRIPSKRDMEQIAWILLTKKAGRNIGFVTAKQFWEIEGDDAEIPTGGCHAKRTLQRTTLLSSAAVSTARAIRPKPK